MRTERKATEQQVSETKERLTQAFKELRKQGIIARQNFMCCLGCGVSSIAQDIEKGILAEKPIQGFVFFHTQNNARFIEGHQFELNYGNSSFSVKSAVEQKRRTVLKNKYRKILSDEKVGELVYNTLKSHGIFVKWSGSANETISVIPQKTGNKKRNLA